MFQKNVLQLFLDKEHELMGHPCFRFVYQDQWKTLSWSDLKTKVIQLSSSLEKSPIHKGDKVALLSSTRYEWTLIDLAIISLGGITVPIYQSMLPKDVLYILKHSEAKVVFVEDEIQLKKVEEIRKDLPNLQKVILIEGKGAGEVPTLDQFLQAGVYDEAPYFQKIGVISLEDIATIVYTSGTTGEPKGVVLSHLNLVSEVDAMGKIFHFSHEDESLMFLPLAHILARAVQFFQLANGFIHAYAQSIEKLLDDIQAVRPHFMACVPRIFEKIHTKILNDVEHSSPLKQKIFHWAVSVGSRVSQLKQKEQPIPFPLSLQYSLAHKLVFSKLEKKLGGRIRFFISGGAPLSQEVAEFFHAAGILILEGYGLTETTAAINCNGPEKYRFGTVGPMTAYTEEKIAEDGEILVKGTHVFKEYFHNPQATQEAFTADGYFKTGDIGEFADQGFLRITDRKKDIIVTAAGKNIAPQPIENLIKTDPYISQVMVHGDKRKFLTALITLNPDEIKNLGEQLGLKGKSSSELAHDSKVHEFMKKRIEEKNKELASYETIKRFAILEEDFSIEKGELTPTLKVKRKEVTRKFQDVLDRLYQE